MNENLSKLAQPEEARGGLAHDAFVAVVGGIAGGAVGPVVDQVTNLFSRPPEEQPAQVVLPPGVHNDDK